MDVYGMSPEALCELATSVTAALKLGDNVVFPH